MCDGGLAGDRVVRDTEEQAVGVSDGIELELNLLDEAFRGVISFWNLDSEKMRIALIIGCIQTEHCILLRSGEMVVSVGNFHGGYSGFDDVFIRMGETVQEVGRRFCGIVSETGVNIEDMSAEVVGVGDGILSVDFVCFDVEHSRSSEAAVRLLIGYVKKTKQWARRRRAGLRPAGFSLSPLW